MRATVAAGVSGPSSSRTSFSPGLAAEDGELELGHRAARPEAGEERAQLGPGQGDDQEGAVGQVAQRGVDELERGAVAPVHVVEDQEHRPRRALGGEEVLEGAAHLVAHEHRVLPRGAQLDALSSGKGTPTSSPRKRVTRARSAPRSERPRRSRELLAACTSAGSPASTPAVRWITGASRPKGAPARIGSPRPSQSSKPPAPPVAGGGSESPVTARAAAASPRASAARDRRRRSSSCRSRDLPTPGGAVTMTARATPSPATSAKMASSVVSSRSRPTNGVAPAQERARRLAGALGLQGEPGVVAAQLEGRRDQAGDRLVDTDGPRAGAPEERDPAIEDLAQRRRRGCGDG